MKKMPLTVLAYTLLTTSVAWAQDAMHFYRLGIDSSLANKRVGFDHTAHVASRRVDQASWLRKLPSLRQAGSKRRRGSGAFL